MMRALRGSRFVPTLVALALLWQWFPAPLLAQEPAAAPTPMAGDSTDSGAPLGEARDLIKSGDYDGAIRLLKPVIERSRDRAAELRDAYLLLIKSHVYLANELKTQAQGKVSSDLMKDEARKLIAECLGTKSLRHTRLESVSEYPEEMISLFDETRTRMFGAFRVAKYEPRGATLLFDADTLRAMPGDTLLGDVDIPAGVHRVVVSARGYRDLTEQVNIPSGSTLDRSYRLARRRGGLWYATRITGAVGAVGGAIALTRGGGTTTLSPLPGAPDPPTGR